MLDLEDCPSSCRIVLRREANKASEGDASLPVGQQNDCRLPATPLLDALGPLTTIDPLDLSSLPPVRCF